MITMRDLKKSGLHVEFRKAVKGFIPRQVEDSEARRYVQAIMAIAESSGLVGPPMMRQVAQMKVNRAVDPGLYQKIIEFKRRADDILSKKKSAGATDAKAQAAPSDEESDEAETTVSGDVGESGGEPEDAEGSDDADNADETEEAEASASVATKEVAGRLKKMTYEGVTFFTGEHPEKPAALKKYGYLWPVPPGKLWRYKTAKFKTFVILAGAARTEGAHYKIAKRDGMTMPQWVKYWKQWVEGGPEIGWLLEETEKGVFLLRPMTPAER